jgi:hypothetical protein
MKNFSEEICLEKQNAQFMFNSFFFDNRTICKVMGEKNCTAE